MSFQSPRPAARALTLLALSCVVLAGCATLPAEEDPIQIRLNDIDTRLGRLERVVNNQSLLELSQRIDALQAEVRQLRGQTEETENAVAAARKQQRDLYADLDRRLAALEAGGAALVGSAAANSGAAASGGATAGGGAAGADAGSVAYGRAFDALKQGSYPAAISGFTAFLRDYPQHELADNAQYWLGQAHYVTRDYPNAIAAFNRVVAQWPDSSKASDALLKVGLSQLELKRPAEARRTLEDVRTRYPGTDSARAAAERLQRLPASP
jgi:tol-pal system protein YbgF